MIIRGLRFRVVLLVAFNYLFLASCANTDDESVNVDLLKYIENVNRPYVYSYDGQAYILDDTWSQTDYIDVEGFNSMTFSTAGYHSGDTTVENVTFYDVNKCRISGFFGNISDNNARIVTATIPIPDRTKYISLAYNPLLDANPTLVLSKIKTTNIICIGDSITEGYISVNEISENNYPNYLQSFLGDGYSVVNAGVGGTHAVSWWEIYKEYIDVSQADIVIIMLGANGGFEDSFKSLPAPYTSYENYPEEGVTVSSCKLVEWLEELNPDLKIIMMTPTYVDQNIAPLNARAAEMQRTLMPLFAERYHYSVIDLFKLEGVNETNSSEWLSDDGVHHTERSYEKIGEIVAEWIKSNI